MQDLFQSVPNHDTARPPLLACGESFGLAAPSQAEISQVYAFVLELIGGVVASPATLGAVHRAAPGSLLIRRADGAVAGLLATLPLRRAGLKSLLGGRFDGVDVDLGLVARPGERPAAIYAWGCAARDSATAKALLGCALALADRVFPDTPFFAKAATAAGRRALAGSLGYEPLDRGGLDMLWRPPAPRQAA